MSGNKLIVRICFILIAAGLAACSLKPRISLFGESTEPLKEYTLQGHGREKILLIPINGFISDAHKSLPFYRRPSMVQQIVSELNKAEKDKEIKAVILKIDSSGGSVSASDMLYNELMRFKAKSGAKVVAILMGVAASGGYYVALPADFIMAHPTTVTGSVGVVFLRPNVSGLMGKIGLEVDVDKSGKDKDMGSPFRKATVEEKEIMKGLIDNMASRFISLVVSHRKLSEEAKASVSTARVYIASDALKVGLVDRIGYIEDAVAKAGELAGLGEKPKVVVYRRSEYHNDNFYNTSMNKEGGVPEVSLLNLGLADSVQPFRTGFYYLWLPGQSE